jgi:ABC-2 type transport system ATP-binding protein
VLDEPTAAMDVAARRATWELLRSLRAEGATILLTTHLLEEAEALADRVAIIDRGRLVGLGAPDDLRATAHGVDGGQRSVRLELHEPLGDDDAAALARLAHVAGLRSLPSGAYAIATTSPGDLLVELTAWLRSKGIEPLRLEVERESLEDVFLRLTGDEAER